jgi:hypothetical protein
MVLAAARVQVVIMAEALGIPVGRELLDKVMLAALL